MGEGNGKLYNFKKIDPDQVSKGLFGLKSIKDRNVSTVSYMLLFSQLLV